MIPVKKVHALFRGSNVARAVAPLQVAPTEMQGTDCPMHCAKFARRDSNARPCSQGYDRSAADIPLLAPAGTNSTTDHGARAVQKCQLAAFRRPASCRPRYRSVIWTGERRKRILNPSPLDTHAKCDMFAQAHGADIPICLSAWQSGIHTPRAHKKRRPFASGHGLRGGRWPGPQVERDGLNCYRGRGWVTNGQSIASGSDLKRRESPPPGLSAYQGIRGPVHAGSSRPADFLMFISAEQSSGDARCM